MTKKGLTQLILSVLLVSAFGPITYVAKSADTSTATTATPTPTATSTPTPTATSTPTPTATSAPATNTCATQGVVNRPDWDSVSWTEYCRGNQIFNIVFVIQGGKQIRVVGTGSSVSISDVTSTTPTPTPTATSTPRTETTTATTSTPRTETTTATTSTPKTETSTATTKTETSTATTLTLITCLTRGAIVSRPDWDSGNWTEICKPPQTFDFILIIKGGIKLRVVGGPSGVSISDYYYPSETKQLATTQSDTLTVTTQSDTRTVTTQSDKRTVTTQSEEKQYTQLVIAGISDSKTRTAETALLINTYENSEKEKVLTVATKSNKSVVMTVNTKIPEVSVLLTATKQNQKPIIFKATTDDEGVVSVKTSKKLSGYAVTLSINGIKVDTDSIKK